MTADPIDQNHSLSVEYDAKTEIQSLKDSIDLIAKSLEDSIECIVIEIKTWKSSLYITKEWIDSKLQPYSIKIDEQYKHIVHLHAQLKDALKHCRGFRTPEKSSNKSTTKTQGEKEMPLKTSKSPKAFKENIKKEKKEGKSTKQSVAIAYSEADKAKKRDKKEDKKKKK